MIEKIKSYVEPNHTLRKIFIGVLCALFIGSISSIIFGTAKIHESFGDITYQGTTEMERETADDEYDEDSTVCDVTYANDEGYLVKSYSYEEFENLDQDSITAYEYTTENGKTLFFDHENPTQQEITATYHALVANETMSVFNLGTALFILALAVGIMLVFSKAFTTYEKCWFLTIMTLATIVAVIFPEESANGVNGIIIILLYLLDTFLNILCELLISKQSRYNFLVSVAVEITEIATCMVLMYRWATIATTLFFWLPIDILSYINWSKHKDDDSEELTAVRRLKGYQEVLVILAIIAWTFIVGYLLSGLNIQTDFLNGNKQLETAIIYIDACASAVGVANGLFIFFRMREQWVAWYICAALEAVINILSGQYVLLVLKLGYFTNTTYGYIKWSRYINTHKEEAKSLF